jgi:two-component system cell cycle response regulator DivK
LPVARVPSGRPQTLPRPVILVADDDPDARFIYSEYLRARGCTVFTAPDGRVAISKATSLAPDAIVMDLAMPYVDGFEAIRRLRESSWTRRLRIIAISAVPESQAVALQAGCDAYLTKPCDPEVLWLQVSSVLRLADSGSQKP